jgi:hypothetical protein
MTYETLKRCYAAAENLHPTECVHVHADGSVTTGTDGWTTVAREWGDITHTWHPSRANDPHDCFFAVGHADEDE